jgi:hypothetical protein
MFIRTLQINFANVLQKNRIYTSCLPVPELTLITQYERLKLLECYNFDGKGWAWFKGGSDTPDRVRERVANILQISKFVLWSFIHLISRWLIRVSNFSWECQTSQCCFVLGARLANYPKERHGTT